jgi:hypothetical protein
MIRRLVSMDKEVIFFGASRFASVVFSYLDEGFKVSYFCDNDSKKWGQIFCGVKVISPGDLSRIKNPRVIITSQYVQEITKQLFEMGIKEIEVAEIISEKSSEKKCKVLFKKYDYSKKDSLDKVHNRICLITSNVSGSNTYALWC